MENAITVFFYLLALAIRITIVVLSYQIAKKKGYPKAGLFLGLFLGIIGLIITLVLEDLNPENHQEQEGVSLTPIFKPLPKGLQEEKDPVHVDPSGPLANLDDTTLKDQFASTTNPEEKESFRSELVRRGFLWYKYNG